MLAVSVMSGGCGGSSTSSVSSPQSANDTISGAWHYDSGTVTANVNGQSVKMTVLNFAVLFESCDIEEESGSAVFTAVAPLQGEHFMLPMLFEKMAITTTRSDIGTWTADTEHGQFTVELLDNDRARLTGSVNWFGEGFASADIDVVINKLPSTAPTIDINTALDGEWQTPLLSEDNGRPIFGGGGYIFHEGNIAPIEQTFMTMTFKDTNIQEGNMTATGTCIQEMMYSDEYDGTYIIMDHTAFNLEHMFGNVYRIANDQLAAIFMLEDENKLTILNRIYNMFNGSIEENRAMFSLNKTTGVDTVNIYDYAGSSWRSSACVLNAYEKDGADFTLVDAGMSSFDVSFLSTDIENKTLTLSTNAVVTTLDGTAPVENFSAVLSVESAVLNMENTGYNTWLGKSENGNLFTVTMLTDKMALITADIGYTRNDWYDVDIFAVMQRVDPE